MSDSARDMTKNKIPFKLLEKSEQDKLVKTGKRRRE